MHTQITGLTSLATAKVAGYLPCLPRSLGLCYFIPNTPNNLLSLGYLVKKGGLYIGFNGKLHVLFCENGKIISSLSPLNNSLVHPAIVTDGRIFHDASINEKVLFDLLGLSIVDDSLLMNLDGNLCHVAVGTDKEIADKVKILHHRMAHPGLNSMYRSAKNGDFGEFSKENVKLYEEIHHPCPACVAGKWKHSIKALPQKVPQAPTKPGELLVFDINKLTHKTNEGYTQRLVLVDYYTGYLVSVGTKSKFKCDILPVLKSIIALSFTARGWSVNGTVCDSESVFTSLSVDLAEMKIEPSFCPPLTHAKFVERFIQTSQNRSNTMVQSLPFEIPSQYLLRLFQYVIGCVNLLANNRTSSLVGENQGKSPRDIVTKNKLYPFHGLPICFGDVCLIQIGEPKRNDIRKKRDCPLQLVEKAMPGVVIGFSESLTDFDFLTDNGRIITRSFFSLVNKALPFNWKLKPSLFADSVTSDSVTNASEDLFIPATETLTFVNDECDDLLPDNSAEVDKESNNPEGNDFLLGVVQSLVTTPSLDVVQSLPVDVAQSLPVDVVQSLPVTTQPLIVTVPSVEPPAAVLADITSDTAPVAAPTNVTVESNANVGEITEPLFTYFLPFIENGKVIQGMKRFALNWKNYTRTDGSFDKTFSEMRALGFSKEELNKLPSRNVYETLNGLPPDSLVVTSPSVPRIVKGPTKRIPVRPINQDVGKIALAALYKGLLQTGMIDDCIKKLTPVPINYIEIPDKYYPDFERLFNAMEKFNTESTFPNSTIFANHPCLPKDPAITAGILHDRKNKKRCGAPERKRSDKMRELRCSSPSTRLDIAFTAVADALREDLDIDDEYLQAIKSSATGGVHSLASAIKYSLTMAGAAVEIEMSKMERLNVFTEVFEHLLELGAVVMDAVSVFKVKTDPLDGSPIKMTYRLAVNGKQQPIDTYDETYAATSNKTYVTLAKAALYAFAVKHGIIELLFCADLDIAGAFLNADYTSTVGKNLYMRLPKKLPGNSINNLHELAGKIVRLNKALYGLPEANMLFEIERNIVILSCDFYPTSVDVSIFTKTDPENNLLRSHLYTTVDDIQTLSTCRRHWEELKEKLTVRFGELTINEISTQHAGVTHEAFANGSFRSTQSGYIKKFCEELGVNRLANPFSSVPSNTDLFDDSTDTTPVKQRFYQKLIGTLIYCLLTRHDVRKEIIYLASLSGSPTVGDLIKLTRVFRYLNATADVGPLYYSDEGPILYGYCDAAWANHPDLRSHAGYFACIGRNSAPFASHSSKIKSCIVMSSMEAEYISLCELTKLLVVCRRFLSEIGFPQPGPTIVFEDNQSAINLAVAPSVGTRSKHILLKYHYTKDAVKLGEILLEFTKSADQRSDGLTKVQTKPVFLRSTDNLLNGLRK